MGVEFYVVVQYRGGALLFHAGADEEFAQKVAEQWKEFLPVIPPFTEEDFRVDVMSEYEAGNFILKHGAKATIINPGQLIFVG